MHYFSSCLTKTANTFIGNQSIFGQVYFPGLVTPLSIVVSNLIISLIRNLVPNRVRIIVQLAVIATLVTLVSEVLKAYNYEMFKVLGAFIGLIITNCIIMGRLEAFAMGNKPYDSILDGLGSGISSRRGQRS